MKNRPAISDEAFTILEWQDEGLPAICVVNQSLAHTGAVRVVGSQTVIVLGKPGIEAHSNGECTFTGGGFSPETIEPFDEAFTLPVHIAGA